MFFRHLHAVARHTPLHIIITPNGEQLRLVVTPKPSGDAADNPALAKPFTAVGTPEELDAELPEVLRKYTESVNDLRMKLDLPLDALEQAKKKVAEKADKKAEKAKQEKEEAERRSEAAKKAAETRAANAAAAAAEAERKKKEKEDAKAAKKLAKAGGKAGAAPTGTGIQLPGATATQPPAAPEDTVAHRADLPGKAECIRDYTQLKTKHGDKLKRKLFIKKAETGRRYEKLWPNWEKFVKEAEAQPELQLEPASTAATGGDKSEAAPASESKADRSGAAETEPASAGEAQPAPVAVLERNSRALLGTYAGDPLEGALITLADKGLYQVDKVTPNVEILAHRVHEEPWRLLDAQGKELGGTVEILACDDKLLIGDEEHCVLAVLEADKAYTVKPTAPRFEVYDEEGGRITSYKWQPSEGEKLTVDGFPNPYRVIEVDGMRVTARKLLSFKKSILTEGGDQLGMTEEIYDIADQVAEIADKEWRVVRVEENAYIVRAAKPKLKGPAAVAAPAATE